VGTLTSPISEEHLVALGRVTANFSQLEDELNRLAWDLVGDFIVGQIVTAELSFKALLNLVSALGRHRLGEAALMTELQEAIAKAATAEDERNVIIHSIWFAGHTNDDVHRVKITAKRKVGRRVQSEQVSPADIEKVAQHLAEATFVVMQVHAKHR